MFVKWKIEDEFSFLNGPNDTSLGTQSSKAIIFWDAILKANRGIQLLTFSVIFGIYLKLDVKFIYLT